VTLEWKLPEDFSENIALYTVKEGVAQVLESTVAERVLTAETETLGELVLCDLDVPYAPPETVPPETQPPTEPSTQPAVTTAAPKQASRDQASTEILLWALGMSMPAAALVTLVITFAVRKRQEKISMD
jgi:hypothetical protein